MQVFCHDNNLYSAATWVQSTRLFMPSALVEVEVIAHLPRGNDKKCYPEPACRQTGLWKGLKSNTGILNV